MIGFLIGAMIELIGLMIALLIVALRLMIRGSVLLVAAIAGALETRRRTRVGMAPARAPLDPAVRWAVFQRDRYACLHCGSHSDLTIDHIHPVSLGGLNDPTNLQTLCRGCNSRKGVS
jgi:hypothetical protein